MEVLESIKKAKIASQKLFLDDKQINEIINYLADELVSSTDIILEENKKDLDKIDKNLPIYDRLLLTKDRIKSIADDSRNVTTLPSPLNKELEHKIMPNGLDIKKISVPLGVVGVIYESRPNVTIDVFSLCFKSGNACVLKGGKESNNTNAALVNIIRKSLEKFKINIDTICLLPSNRESAAILLNAVGLIDVCIPRGSKSLIDFTRDNAKIPVIETGAGIVHIYFDSSGDVTKGKLIINNAKTRKVSVCNALDCLLINSSRLDDLYELVKLLENSNVEIFADELSYKALENKYKYLFRATKDDFNREFLSYKMAVKVVNNIEEAIEHINTNGSGHSESIITEDDYMAEYFIKKTDASAVYVNASTAFTDGGQFGMGAEIGISTQKLHARGPMGLEALVSYKWIVHGNGHIRE
jgi:glutamate-5-semialdehyde dehydrogenase